VSDIEAQLAELIDAPARAPDDPRGRLWPFVVRLCTDDGISVLPEGMSWAKMVDGALAKPRAPVDRLVEVGSGTRIRAVNAFLDQNGLALTQMGGYDGQTLAGVISTSTHESGIAFPPFPDYVQSIDLIDGLGQRRRIEPSDGSPTPLASSGARGLAAGNRTDDWFTPPSADRCMGIVLSCVRGVRERFRLTERRERRAGRR